MNENMKWNIAYGLSVSIAGVLVIGFIVIPFYLLLAWAFQSVWNTILVEELDNFIPLTLVQSFAIVFLASVFLRAIRRTSSSGESE